MERSERIMSKGNKICSLKQKLRLGAFHGLNQWDTRRLAILPFAYMQYHL